MAYKNKADQAAAARRHYLANKEAMVARARSWSDQNRKRTQQYIFDLKSQTACMDCNKYWDPCQMDFDHRDPTTKKFGVADAIQRSITFERVKAEIAKCDLVCANCHRLRTYKRRNLGVGSIPAPAP